MRKLIKTITVLAILIWATTCIDRFEVDTGNELPQYAVDGFITDGPGPHYIRVQETIEFSNKPSNLILNATVQIHGSDGLVVDAIVRYLNWEGHVVDSIDQYRSVHMFRHGVFQAVPGVAYKIVVQIEKFTIESEEQTLPSLMPMTDLDFSPASIVVQRDYDDRIIDQDGMLLQTSLAKTINPAYYLWDIESGYEYVADLASDQSNSRTCWFIEPYEYKDIYIHRDIEGGYKKNIVFAPRTIKHKVDYTMLIRQYNISESAYRFWSQVSDQKANVGSIFDKTPSSVFGNLYSTTNPEERVLGYFGVYGFSEKRVFFNDLDYPHTEKYGDLCAGPQPPRSCRICSQYLGGGNLTRDKPSWWR